MNLAVTRFYEFFKSNKVRFKIYNNYSHGLSVVEKISISFLLCLFVISNCFAVDSGTKRYGAYFAKSSDYVVIGKFKSLPSQESSSTDRLKKGFYLKTMVVDVFLKGDKNYDELIYVNMPNVYKLLPLPEKLREARMESRRLSGCKSQLLGTFKRHPEDKIKCETNVEEIEIKQNKPGFKEKALLGYFLERGWQLNFKEDQRFLAFLKRGSDHRFSFEMTRHLVPLADESVEEIKALLFPDELDLDAN